MENISTYLKEMLASFDEDGNTGDDCQESPLESFAKQVIQLCYYTKGESSEHKAFALKCDMLGYDNLASFYFNLFPNTETPAGNTVLLFTEGDKKYVGGTTYICDNETLFAENKRIAKGITNNFLAKKAVIYTCVSPKNIKYHIPPDKYSETENATYYCLAENGMLPRYAHYGNTHQEALASAVNEACRLSDMLNQRVYVVKFLPHK